MAHRADVAFDPVGGETWGKGIDSLAKGGRLLSLGLTSGPSSEVDVGKLYRGELGIVGTYAFRREDLVKVLRLVGEGRLNPRVYKELPLKSAREAHELIESQVVQGKILLIP